MIRLIDGDLVCGGAQRVRRARAIGGIVLAAALAVPAAGTAEETAEEDRLTWSIRSDYPYVVSLQFFSRDGDRAWPGGGDVYLLDDSAAHDFLLECDAGETICYGAWVRGDPSVFWGVGQDGRQGCTGCCYVCGGGDTDLLVLYP